MSKRKTDDLAVRIGERLTARVGPAIPRDLNKLAKSLGVVDILYRTRIRHGYTEWTGRGPTIQIALSNTDGRRRATLAHECGHLILDPVFRPGSFSSSAPESQWRQTHLAHEVLGPIFPAVVGGSQNLDLEFLCDRLAVELMLPASRVRQIAERVTTLESLKAVSGEYRVSLAMLVIRLNEFGSHHSLLQMERAVSGDWLVSNAIGVPPEWRGRVVGVGLEDGSQEGHRKTRILTLQNHETSMQVLGNVAIVGRNRAVIFLSSTAFTAHESTAHSHSMPRHTAGTRPTGMPLSSIDTFRSNPAVDGSDGCAPSASHALPKEMRAGRHLPPASAATG